MISGMFQWRDDRLPSAYAWLALQRDEGFSRPSRLEPSLSETGTRGWKRSQSQMGQRCHLEILRPGWTPPWQVIFILFIRRFLGYLGYCSFGVLHFHTLLHLYHTMKIHKWWIKFELCLVATGKFLAMNCSPSGLLLWLWNTASNPFWTAVTLMTITSLPWKNGETAWNSARYN